MVSDGKIYTLKIGYNRILNERARAREKLVWARFLFYSFGGPLQSLEPIKCACMSWLCRYKRPVYVAPAQSFQTDSVWYQCPPCLSLYSLTHSPLFPLIRFPLSDYIDNLQIVWRPSFWSSELANEKKERERGTVPASWDHTLYLYLFQIIDLTPNQCHIQVNTFSFSLFKRDQGKKIKNLNKWGKIHYIVGPIGKKEGGSEMFFF